MYRKEDLNERDGRYFDDEGNEWIPSTQRADGTWRPARRVKSGYIPIEERKVYRPPMIAMRERLKAEAARKENTPQRKVAPKPSTAVGSRKSDISSVSETISEPIPEKHASKEESKAEDKKELTLSEEECIKKIRELRKQLSQVDNLIQKRDNGLQLESGQLELVGKRMSFVQELSSVLSSYLRDSLKWSSEELTCKLKQEDYQKFVVLVEWIRQFKRN